MRPDAARYMRPDAARFIRPDVARFLRPGTDPADVFPALDRKYSPSQRRIPAGRPGGGRWTSEEAQGGSGGGMPMAAAGPDGELSGDMVSSDTGMLAFGDEGTSLPIDTIDWGIDGISFDGERTSETAPTFIDPNSTDLTSTTPDDPVTDSRVLSDADPDPVRPGDQYAQANGGRRGSGPISINGQLLQPTPAQSARLAVTEAQADAAIARVREIEPRWSPSPSWRIRLKAE